MSEANTGGSTCGANHPNSDNAAPLGAEDGLCLAAAPTFALMALLVGVFGGDQPDLLCLAGHNGPLLGAMVSMYLLMSAFHSAPWLKLISGRRPPRKGRAPPAF